MKTPSPRAQYILDTYHLEQTPDGWRAWNTFEGRVLFEKVASTREEVIHYARCWWGHFNFEDEAEAFNTIFPPAYAAVRKAPRGLYGSEG